jgi:hypothetical protein
VATLNAYKGSLDDATKFIPTWVKIVVAIALGLGTMIGWKRIVITVGEKIGKTHLTYAQGACAEITAAATIAVADGYGLPVSTTHVLSSGVAGTMAANGSGLQLATIRNIATAWVMTLPAASGSLYWIFSYLFKWAIPVAAQQVRRLFDLRRRQRPRMGDRLAGQRHPALRSEHRDLHHVSQQQERRRRAPDAWSAGRGLGRRVRHRSAGGDPRLSTENARSAFLIR